MIVSSTSYFNNNYITLLVSDQGLKQCSLLVANLVIFTLTFFSYPSILEEEDKMCANGLKQSKIFKIDLNLKIISEEQCHLEKVAISSASVFWMNECSMVIYGW